MERNCRQFVAERQYMIAEVEQHTAYEFLAGILRERFNTCEIRPAHLGCCLDFDAGYRTAGECKYEIDLATSRGAVVKSGGRSLAPCELLADLLNHEGFQQRANIRGLRRGSRVGVAAQVRRNASIEQICRYMAIF
jgi:hypothetical protein